MHRQFGHSWFAGAGRITQPTESHCPDLRWRPREPSHDYQPIRMSQELSPSAGSGCRKKKLINRVTFYPSFRAESVAPADPSLWSDLRRDATTWSHIEAWLSGDGAKQRIAWIEPCPESSDAWRSLESAVFASATTDYWSVASGSF